MAFAFFYEQLSYYIHRNPLRAGIVHRVTDSRWSSYNVYAYSRKAPKWLVTDLILDQFAGEQDRQWLKTTNLFRYQFYCPAGMTTS